MSIQEDQSRMKIPPPAESPTSGPDAGQRLDSVSTILSHLEDFPGPNPIPGPEENKLLTVKLGIASSLFQSLRVRHTPTALHSLRVAFGCSVWARSRGLEVDEQHALEVAALLHDIGKIGAPDSILKQPTSLTTDQAAQIAETRRYGLTILSTCCPSRQVLESVAYASAWYDGSSPEFDRQGSQIPLGARMIAIVDAFDAMTTDRVYRQALPHDQALAELFRCSGSQFDPQLVQELAGLLASGTLTFHGDIAARWLTSLDAPQTDQIWRLQLPENDVLFASHEELQFQYLFDSTIEGAFFIDPGGVIANWNRAVARQTGITAEGMVGQTWDPSLLKMKHANGRIARYQDCPVLRAIHSGQKSRQGVMVRGGDGDFLHIDLHVVPVVSCSGYQVGVLVLMRDATSEQDLEERVSQLHLQATSDPLTGVANRAEFDRWHRESIEKHTEAGSTCSLIICDIDRFKSINDVYGHQAGDEALVSFSGILQRNCRDGDLVARYGGEEFVMVCEDCSLTEAVKIAETIRRELEKTPLKELSGKCITASFGVTELQPGDSDESMLRRADRGLLNAKETGRNKVVQLGSGMVTAEPESSQAAGRAGWWPWNRSAATSKGMEWTLETNVPLPLMAEKLRGFVSDHKADIVRLSQEDVVIQVTTDNFQQARRSSDRPINFRLELHFLPGDGSGGVNRLLVRLTPTRTRDRRTDVSGSAKLLLRSLQSYLMAQLAVDDAAEA